MGYDSVNRTFSKKNKAFDSADGLPTQTGIAPIDEAVTRTLAFEKSHLGNPLVQFTLLGLAGFGAYVLIKKIA